MLEMIAECVAGTNYAIQETPWTRKLLDLLRDTASSLPQDKPERKMPEVGDSVIYLSCNRSPFTLFETIWHNTISDRHTWNNGFIFLLSERELAEKKCAELNKILAS